MPDVNKRIRNSSATSAERQATTALDVLAKSSLPSLLAQACPTDDLPYVAKFVRTIIFANFVNMTAFVNLFVRMYTLFYIHYVILDGLPEMLVR